MISKKVFFDCAVDDNKNVPEYQVYNKIKKTGIDTDGLSDLNSKVWDDEYRRSCGLDLFHV